MEEGRARAGDTLAFVAFGAGLTWAAAVVKLGERPAPARVSRWSIRLPDWVTRPVSNWVDSARELLRALTQPSYMRKPRKHKRHEP